MAIKPQDLINQLEEVINELSGSVFERTPVSDIRATLLGMVDELYCETWCDDKEDCYYENICNECEYSADCENAEMTDDDDEEIDKIEEGE